MKLTDFTVLTFDCYGTLIDWETGIHAALQPLLSQAGVAFDKDEALQRFARHESDQQAETPGMIYSDLLAEVHRRLARELGADMPDEAHRRFGASVPDWPAFADSASTLRYLKQHYRLAILSNVDRASFAGSNAKLGVTFDAIYTAEDIGSYKPDPRNFAFMIGELGKLGVKPDAILLTAQSLFHDHVPGRRAGLSSAWIDRRYEQAGWGATMPAPDGSYDFRFTSLAEMAAAHRALVDH